MSKQANNALVALGNPSVPLAHRVQQTIDILACAKGDGDGNQELSQEIANEMFKRLQNTAVDEVAAKRSQMLGEILNQIMAAPLRPATFIQMANLDGALASHAMVSMDNGELAYIAAHDQAMAKKLKLGARVMVDGNMKIMVSDVPDGLHFGGEARFERHIDKRHIEVVTHQDDKLIVLIGPDLAEQIEKGEVEPGAAIVLGANNRIGFYAVPVADKMHFRFLDKGPVPNIIVERDMGSPPAIIKQISQHVREEMTRPELRRKFGLRPCATRLLCGVSGTGKTMTVDAIWRKIYEIMSEVTGTPIDQLPKRVFRFRQSQMLSMWLGESDKNIDRLFDEVEEMAEVPFTNAKGKEFKLPVLVILEEADGAGRARGQEAIYDRIMTTLLQRLDPNRASLASRMIVFLSTTNTPHVVDPAFLRRIGGSVETFGRIDQKGFESIMEKHVAGLPAEAKWPKIIGTISEWMFEGNGDSAVVELHLQGSQQPMVKHRKDFITPALIDRAVQEASTKAWEMAIGGDKDAAIKSDHLIESLHNQVLSVAHQLHPANVGDYLDLPDGVRVAGIKHLQKKQHANK